MVSHCSNAILLSVTTRQIVLEVTFNHSGVVKLEVEARNALGRVRSEASFVVLDHMADLTLFCTPDPAFLR